MHGNMNVYTSKSVISEIGDSAPKGPKPATRSYRKLVTGSSHTRIHSAPNTQCHIIFSLFPSDRLKTGYPA